MYSKDGYKRNSKDRNNPYNVIPSGDITMEGVDFPVYGIDDLGNEQIMMPGAHYTFPGNEVFEVPIRRGAKQNYTNTAWTPSGLQFPSSESTHVMAREYIPGRGWVAFPTLFQNSTPYEDEELNWIDMRNQPWEVAFREAEKRGEVIDFGEDEKAAIQFADEGNWKKEGGELPEAQFGSMLKKGFKNLSDFIFKRGAADNITKGVDNVIPKSTYIPEEEIVEDGAGFFGEESRKALDAIGESLGPARNQLEIIENTKKLNPILETLFGATARTTSKAPLKGSNVTKEYLFKLAEDAKLFEPRRLNWKQNQIDAFWHFDQSTQQMTRRKGYGNNKLHGVGRNTTHFQFPFEDETFPQYLRRIDKMYREGTKDLKFNPSTNQFDHPGTHNMFIDYIGYDENAIERFMRSLKELDVPITGADFKRMFPRKIYHGSTKTFDTPVINWNNPDMRPPGMSLDEFYKLQADRDLHFKGNPPTFFGTFSPTYAASYSTRGPDNWHGVQSLEEAAKRQYASRPTTQRVKADSKGILEEDIYALSDRQVYTYEIPDNAVIHYDGTTLNGRNYFNKDGTLTNKGQELVDNGVDIIFGKNENGGSEILHLTQSGVDNFQPIVRATDRTTLHKPGLFQDADILDLGQLEWEHTLGGPRNPLIYQKHEVLPNIPGGPALHHVYQGYLDKMSHLDIPSLHPENFLFQGDQKYLKGHLERFMDGPGIGYYTPYNTSYFSEGGAPEDQNGGENNLPFINVLSDPTKTLDPWDDYITQTRSNYVGHPLQNQINITEQDLADGVTLPHEMYHHKQKNSGELFENPNIQRHPVGPVSDEGLYSHYDRRGEDHVRAFEDYKYYHSGEVFQDHPGMEPHRIIPRKDLQHIPNMIARFADRNMYDNPYTTEGEAHAFESEYMNYPSYLEAEKAALKKSGLYEDVIDNLKDVRETPIRTQIRKHGGRLSKAQNGTEYDEKGYRIQQYGNNYKKWTPTEAWSEYEEYTRDDKGYRKRYFNLNSTDLDYLRSNKSFLKDTRTHGSSFPQLLDYSKSRGMRVRETIGPGGRPTYTMEYKTQNGWRQGISGNENSGLAKLTPEYVDNLKKKGFGPLPSSWTDMTRDERRNEYKYEDWINTEFSRDLRINKHGDTWGGWKKYGDKSPLHYNLKSTDLAMIPSSLKQKYDLHYGGRLRMSPLTGEIYVVSQTGSHQATINQKDMKWFKNPGRLGEAYLDDRYSNKNDNIFDYLNNYDFTYWQDDQPISLEEKKITEIPINTNTELTKPRPHQEIISLDPIHIDQIPTDNEQGIIKKRELEETITLDPVELEKIDIEADDEIIKSPGSHENIISLDEIKIDKIPSDYDDSLLPYKPIENTITLDKTEPEKLEITNTGDLKTNPLDQNADIDTDWTGPEIILRPQDQKIREVPKHEDETTEDIFDNLKNVRGTTKYVNKSAQAILDAMKTNEYGDKDLTRDLDIFKKHYGDDNLELLRSMIEKNKTPGAKEGIELKNFQDGGENDPGWFSKRLSETVNPIDYDINNALKGFILGKRQPFMWDGTEQTFDTFGDNLDISKDQAQHIKNSSMDAWLKYLGLPQENETFIKSEEIPTIRRKDEKGKGNYWKFKMDDDIWNFVANLQKMNIPNAFSEEWSEQYPQGMLVGDSGLGGFTLKNFNITKGFDDEAGLPYLAYHDEFDFDIPVMGMNIPGEKIAGKPYNIYGRMYYDLSHTDDQGTPKRIYQNEIDNIGVDKNSLKVGIIKAESLNGVLMSNTQENSTASGLYGQRYSELSNNNLYNGTREEFLKDIDSQNDIFSKRVDGTLFENEKGLEESGKDLYYEFRNEIDMPFSQTEIAALTNFLGRSGTRKFLRDVLRDGKSLEEIFPDSYGENKVVKNLTPMEYIEEFRGAVKEYNKTQNFENYILNNLPPEIANQFFTNHSSEELAKRSFGGELKGKFEIKWERLRKDLKTYKEGGSISNISKEELMNFDLIEKPKIKEIEEEQPTKEYNLITIGKDKYNLNDQVRIYTDYLNDNIDNKKEKNIKKIIDKINTIYYNDSKSNNVHVYDYIKGLRKNLQV